MQNQATNPYTTKLTAEKVTMINAVSAITVTCTRPAMLHGVECWPTKIRHVQQLSVAEMRMLRWICGHTRMNRVRNDDIRDA